MNEGLSPAITPRVATSSAVRSVGLPLAFLWGLHAAANYVPGTGYVRLPILFLTAAALLVRRRSAVAAGSGDNSSVAVSVGLGCWFVAATFSTILNWQTEEVLSTYVFVFLSGGAVFVAFRGMRCTPAALDVAVAGLAAGALFPLVGGLLAFNSEWGSPDVTTTISAWHNIVRMTSYTEATFGNRGNTAGFLLIVTPLLLATVLDRGKRLSLRALCVAAVILIALNLIIVQVRAAFITLFVAVIVVWWFKLGSRRLPLMGAILILAWVLLFRVQPDVGVLMTERILPAVTVDTEADESVQGRVDAITEGVRIARRNWLLGIGPGGALTLHTQGSAHQFQLQQGMETGILGLIGSTVFAIGILTLFCRTAIRGRGDETNDIRFMLLIGPAAFVAYAVISNAALTNGSVNTWTVLLASMLAVVPGFPSPAGTPLTESRRTSRLARASLDGVRRHGTADRLVIARNRWRYDVDQGPAANAAGDRGAL
jgi:hypothetical protein